MIEHKPKYSIKQNYREFSQQNKKDVSYTRAEGKRWGKNCTEKCMQEWRKLMGKITLLWP